MGYSGDRKERRSQIFGDIGDPIDWAEDQAHEIVVTLFDTTEISFTLRRFAEELIAEM